MTVPRQVLRGTTYLVTRRCLQQQFLLTPRRLINELFAYQLALAAKRTGVEIHAYCVMSNHYHLLVTDPLARLPEFHQQLDSVVARAVNALLGRSESFWKPGSYSAVPLETEEDVVAKAVYVLANPVAARLVRKGRKWPGLWSSPSDIEKTVRVARPAHFYDPHGRQPEEVELELKVPPGFDAAKGYREALEAGLAEREATLAADGSGFAGAARVRRRSPFDRPRPKERRRDLNPRVAARDRGLRIELIRRLKAFWAAYRDALLVWREGKAEPTFPAGTYLMRVAHGVACADAGAG